MTEAVFPSFATWLALTLAMLALIAAAIVWAVRTGQFADQRHAAELPLRARIPEDDEGKEPTEEDADDAT